MGTWSVQCCCRKWFTVWCVAVPLNMLRLSEIECADFSNIARVIGGQIQHTFPFDPFPLFHFVRNFNHFLERHFKNIVWQNHWCMKWWVGLFIICFTPWSIYLILYTPSHGDLFVLFVVWLCFIFLFVKEGGNWVDTSWNLTASHILTVY